MPSIQFLGAARTVTGSKHLLAVDGRRILIDCGLFQGPRKLRRRNWEPLPVDAASIDAVVLTHAHIDHTGYLPRLIKNGFDGPVFATPATADLIAIMLEDSGHLQEEEARYRNKRGKTRFEKALPLYTAAEGIAAAGKARAIDFRTSFSLGDGIEATFFPAGHIIGSAFVGVEFEAGGSPMRIVFSGDIGRYDIPILPDPTPMGIADYVVTESTYGARVHEHEPIADQLERVVNEVVERGGALIVPAFAVGRTQALMVHINELERAGRIPCLPTYVDSPMAIDAYEIYSRHSKNFDDETWARLTATDTPFRCRDFNLARSREQSMAINQIEGPVIIISASGMASGGRVLHHLRRRLPDPRTTVLIVGYQAQGTRGRALVEGRESVRIFGEDVPIEATIETLNGMSAHAGSNELMAWLGTADGDTKHAFAVHGEMDAAEALVGRIENELGWRASVPEPEQRVELAARSAS